ncbi:hypothetical protein ACROYT_G037445 [Oculina patagonica]
MLLESHVHVGNSGEENMAAAMQTDMERIETDIADLNQQHEEADADYEYAKEVLEDPRFDTGTLQRVISSLEEILEKLHQESFD